MVVKPPVSVKLTGVTMGNSALADAPTPILYTPFEGMASSKAVLIALVIPVVWDSAFKQHNANKINTILFITAKIRTRYEIMMIVWWITKMLLNKNVPVIAGTLGIKILILLKAVSNP